MKNSNIYLESRSFIPASLYKGFLVPGIFALICAVTPLRLVAMHADDSLKKVTPKMTLSIIQTDGDSIQLTTAVKARLNGNVLAADFEPIKFLFVGDSGSVVLGVAHTDDRGVASIWALKKQLNISKDGTWMFRSLFEGNDEISEGEVEGSIKNAGITISADDVDSVHSVSIKLFSVDKDKIPLSKTDVVLYVKRYFSNLKIGTGTTDDNGEVTIECPPNITGDESGNITLIAQAEEIDSYGTISGKISRSWGTRELKSSNHISRELWSHAPPLWMLIVFGILMSVVWGHYFVIIYKFFKIRNQ